MNYDRTRLAKALAYLAVTAIDRRHRPASGHGALRELQVGDRRLGLPRAGPSAAAGVYLFGDYVGTRLGALVQCGAQTSPVTPILKNKDPNTSAPFFAQATGQPAFSNDHRERS